MSSKLPFASDYMHLCHPAILERMAATADTSNIGYGCDAICARAKEKIRQACLAPEAEIHFLIGGTQTNVVAIDAMIPPYQGVLAAETASRASPMVFFRESESASASEARSLSLAAHSTARWWICS